MSEPDEAGRTRERAGRSRERERALAIGHALSMLCAAVAAALAGESIWFGAGGAASLLGWVVLGDRPWTRGELGTLANAVTLARIAGCALLPLVFPLLSPVQFTLLLYALLLIDALDGAIARRSGRTTPFGARLDLEADAFLTLMMCLILSNGGLVGPWILVAGLWRYVYAGLVAAVPVRGEEPRSRRGRAIAALLMLSLSSSFLLGPRWAPPAAALGTVLVSYSFVRSLLWSYRPPRRPPPPS
jgi:phosphatidylglycerophosphate synthase